MNKEYSLTLELFDTESEAKAFCDQKNANANDYIKQNKPARYMPWDIFDGTEYKFAAWYWYER